ncbi:MAG TPA: RecQ family ATP-dependent DNA helicase, partial [Planctomycetota bacterium]|nr:RecQ family ATP-dependent DNA helicase [Planctomycetota bacterium]
LLDGLTIVVSPLIALMDDQVAALQRRGLPATCVHSMLDREQRQARLRAVREGAIKLLYVTPERFRVPGFREAIAAREVVLFAVDEAHCVSQWGHDFRPDYANLGDVRAALGDPPCLALTATATPRVQDDIRAVLRLGDAPLFHTGIERANLFLSVHAVDSEEEKLAHLRARLDAIGGPAIVYFALIKDLERIETELKRDGLRPLVYHGKLSASERRSLQDAFLASPDALILATNAFGMGVDKPDIRCIVHWQIPRTLEAYYQEIGRAGRDGLGSLCELLYWPEDIQIQREFITWANPDRAFVHQVVQHLRALGDRVNAIDADDLRDEFLVKNRRDGRVETVLRLLRASGCAVGELGIDFEWLRVPTDEEVDAFVPEGKQQRDLEGLLAMVRYASERRCRKAAVHAWFGFDYDERHCTACDVHGDVDAFLGRTLPDGARRPIPRAARPAPADAPLQRGDWIDVRGHGLCAVRRVHVERSGIRVDVERASDLSERTFDLRRVRWKKVR